jgi:hypothetical protein
MQKTHQNPKYLMSNGLLNLDDKFYHTLQNSWIWTFILQWVNLMCLKLWNIEWIMCKEL